MPTHNSSSLDSPPSPPPPYPYVRSARELEGIYEGERSLAAILHMDDIVPKVLAFMSTVELLFVQQVCRSWHSHVAQARSTLIRRLHLGQFWSRIGVLPTHHFTTIVSSFHSIVDLNLAYCNMMRGDTMREIVHAVPHFTRLTKLNLFYCYQLTDEDIKGLLENNQLPNLRELNLGRVNKLTDRSVRLLAELPHLTYLNLAHNPSIGEESLMLFDDLNNFPALQILNLLHCHKYRMEEVEELMRSCASSGRNQRLIKAGGAALRVIGPQELFQIDKSGKKMRKDIDADM